MSAYVCECISFCANSFGYRVGDKNKLRNTLWQKRSVECCRLPVRHIGRFTARSVDIFGTVPFQNSCAFALLSCFGGGKKKKREKSPLPPLFLLFSLTSQRCPWMRRKEVDTFYMRISFFPPVPCSLVAFLFLRRLFFFGEVKGVCGKKERERERERKGAAGNHRRKKADCWNTREQTRKADGWTLPTCLPHSQSLCSFLCACSLLDLTSRLGGSRPPFPSCLCPDGSRL